ncbi:unknown protein [Cronobacter turicensis z3032]|uniref:Uncharacterized protein n=1 Tax=Cronobacter turicensis (strain DSM 18703 / CCUG 55852 / LMG 23827 / z3032) TaxID=693216 RepID=C9Y3T9_CROTZ|nr:unknown protein [Cronobacter turicensis z3032]
MVAETQMQLLCHQDLSIWGKEYVSALQQQQKHYLVATAGLISMLLLDIKF